MTTKKENKSFALIVCEDESFEHLTNKFQTFVFQRFVEPMNCSIIIIYFGAFLSMFCC